MKPSQAITTRRQFTVVLRTAAVLVLAEQVCLWLLAQFIR
jgi:hypothetical protein